MGLVQHKRSKHIKLRYHYIRQLVREGVVKVKYHPTQFQPADLLTKPLGRELFARHASVVLGHRPIPYCEQDLELEYKYV